MNIKTIVIILPFIGSTLVAGGDVRPEDPERYARHWAAAEQWIALRNVGVTPIEMILSDTFLSKLRNYPTHPYGPIQTLGVGSIFDSPILLSDVTFTCKGAHQNGLPHKNLFDAINNAFKSNKFLPMTLKDQRDTHGGWLNFFFAIDCDAELNPRIIGYSFGGSVPNEYGPSRLIDGQVDPQEFSDDLQNAIQTMHE